MAFNFNGDVRGDVAEFKNAGAANPVSLLDVGERERLVAPYGIGRDCRKFGKCFTGLDT